MTTYIYSAQKTGRIYGATGSDPSAGVEIAWNIPSGKTWKLKSVTFSMWAGSGSQTPRAPHLVVSGSDGTMYEKIYAGRNYTSGSGTVTYYWISGLPMSTLYTGSTTVVAPLPDNLVVGDGLVVGTSTATLDATDNWTAPTFLVEEY